MPAPISEWVLRVRCFFLLVLPILCLGYTYRKGRVSKEEYIRRGPFPCPGLYCGRKDEDELWYSGCGKCDRGWRVGNNTHSLCEKCSLTPSTYDSFFLAFHVVLVLVLHWVSIDMAANRRRFTPHVVMLHICTVFEVTVAALLSLILSEPVGTLTLTSCTTERLGDWYTFFQNPYPNYEEPLNCTQEAVYPFFTLVFVFYALCVAAMLLFRSLLLFKFWPDGQLAAMDTALYFLPALAAVHAVFGGLVHATFPYIVLVGSLVSSAWHFAFKLDQSPKALVVSCFREGPRSAFIVLGHWALHAFAISALTPWNNSFSDFAPLALVPVPAIFYIATSRFSHPANFRLDSTSAS